MRPLLVLPALLLVFVPQTEARGGTSLPTPAPSTIPSISVQRVVPAPGSMQSIIMGPSGMAAMQRKMQRIAELQRSTRQTMLRALTPAHRELLAQMIGELAVAPDPDLETATHELNAMLSPAEAQTIVRIEQANELATQTIFQQQMPMLNTLQTTVSRPNVMISSGVSASASMPAPFGPDAASILLRTAAQSLMMPKMIVPGPATNH